MNESRFQPSNHLVSSHSAPTHPAQTRSGRVWRWLLFAGCVLLLLAALGQYFSWRQHRDRLIEIVESAQLREDDLLRLRIAGEGHSSHAQLAVARALVYEVLESPRDEATKTGNVERLQQARKLAQEALAAQSTSWQAAMLLGAATYLEQALTQDRKLYTESQAWQAPLLHAIRLAPGKAEPKRFLAAAYLEVWPNLAGERKEKAQALLETTFREDPAAFNLLFATWLAVAADLDEAFGPIPDRPSAWHTVSRAFATHGSWTAFCEGHERYLKSLDRSLKERLADAERRLALGDLYESRSTFLRVVVESPVSKRFAPIVARALENYPPGLHDLGSTQALESWLEWTFDLNTLGQTGLPPLVVSRMAGVAENLTTEQAALAALIGGEISQAEHYERLADTFSTSAWAPYWITKSRWYLERDEIEEAEACLLLIHERFKPSMPSYALTAERVARAAGNPRRLERAQKWIEELHSQEGKASAWRWLNQRASMLLLPERASTAVEIELVQIPDEGAVVEIRWDGTTVALQPVYPGTRLRLPIDIDRALHRLEFQTLAGRTVKPGRVRLVP